MKPVRRLYGMCCPSHIHVSMKDVDKQSFDETIIFGLLFRENLSCFHGIPTQSAPGGEVMHLVSSAASIHQINNVDEDC